MGDADDDSRQLALLWGAAALACLLLSPLAVYLVGALPICPFKQLTGIACPSCGAGRAALALARFDFSDAFLHYPLQSVGWAAFVGIGLWAGVRGFVGKGIPSLPKRLPAWLVVIAITSFLLSWSYSIATGI